MEGHVEPRLGFDLTRLKDGVGWPGVNRTVGQLSGQLLPCSSPLRLSTRHGELTPQLGWAGPAACLALSPPIHTVILSSFPFLSLPWG